MADEKRATIHMIGNSHIDAQWFWRWPEGMREVIATYRSALDRMDEYPNFRFTASSTRHLQWVEELDPDMFEEIRARAREGRWRNVGGWLVEPDCNLPSGESFARQALYGQRFLKSRFGEQADLAYCIDSFGHNAGLPQILAKSGFSRYVFMRPDDTALPLSSALFRWESPNGLGVDALRIPCEYTAWFKEMLDRNLDASIAKMSAEPALVCFYGVGNHGGGPTKANIEHVLEAAAARPDYRLELSDLHGFFADLERSVPPESRERLVGELQHHSVGCYSADSSLKRLNREAERALGRAETYDAFAVLAGAKDFATERLRELWETLLFTQFHDSLAGTCIEEARDDSVLALGGVLDGAERVAQGALQRIAARIDTRGEGFPLILFNARSQALEEWVDTEVAWDCKKPLTLLDDEGREVPYQRVMTSSIMINRNFGGRRRLVFKAKVPALGYAVYRLAERGSIAPLPPALAAPARLENSRLSVGFDPETSLLCSIRLRDSGYEALSGPMVPRVIADENDTWAHAVPGFDQVLGAFELVSASSIEDGSERSCVSLCYRYGASALEQRIYLHSGDDRLFIENLLDWRERHAMLKLALPLAAREPSVRCGMAYASLERSNRDGGEEFYQGWILARDKAAGRALALACEGKYAYDLRDRTLSLTLARSPVYAHHLPTELGSGGRYRYMDQGEQRFKLALRICPSDDAGAGPALLDAIEKPLDAIASTVHVGALEAARHGFVDCDASAVRVEALKGAEDGQGLIVRLWDGSGSGARARVGVSDWKQAMELVFREHEVRSLRFDPPETGRAPRAVDLLENEE